MDPNNPVVKLCLAGMAAEGGGKLDEAHALFQQAWQARQDAYDGCIAAHYLARHQPPAAMLHWNQVALEQAQAVAAARVQEFYPSLYLNLGWSYEQLNQPDQAAAFYNEAALHLDQLPAGPYADVVRRGVTAGLARLATTSVNDGV